MAVDWASVAKYTLTEPDAKLRGWMSRMRMR